MCESTRPKDGVTLNLYCAKGKKGMITLSVSILIYFECETNNMVEKILITQIYYFCNTNDIPE